MSRKLNTQLVAIVKNELQFRETDELMAIWQTNNRDEWTAEAFEAVRSLLLERLGSVPPQTPGPASPVENGSEAQRYLDQAQALEAQGKHARALEAATTAVRLAPRLAPAHFFRGLLFDADGRWLEAIRSYREAIRLDPQLTEAVDNLRAAERQWLELGGPELTPDGAVVTDQLLSGDYATQLSDVPETLYLSEMARLLPGWPGYRMRPGRSGYDYLDTQFEAAHMEGVLLRRIFTGRLRTRSWFGLALMAGGGLLLVLPLILGIPEIMTGNTGIAVAILLLGFYWIPGLFLLWNVIANIVEMTAQKVEAPADPPDA